MMWAFVEGSAARVHAMPHQHPVGGRGDDAGAGAGGGGKSALSPVPAWHPERAVPLSDLSPAEQQWWRNLERRLR